MANLGINIAKGIIKYTKNGGRLLSKTTTGNIRTTIVETDFGKGLKTITQTFDDEGKLAGMSIRHTRKGKEVSSLHKLYSKNNGEINVSTSFSDGLNTTNTKEKQRIITELDGTKSMLRRKVSKTPITEGIRQEEQAYEYLTNVQNKDLHRTLYTSATRLDNGQLINKTVNGNLPNLDEIAKDPYLHIRNYTDKDFAQSASYIAAENQGVSRGKFIDKKLKTCGGYYNGLTNKIAIDSSQHILKTKSGLVNTLNHEYRHKYQHAQIRKMFERFLNIFRTDRNKIVMTPLELKQAKAFGKADLIYCPMELNYNKYYNNILEVDARKAGLSAEKAYYDYSFKLAETFHSEVFGQLFDCLDTSGLLRFLKKAKTINLGIFDSTRAAKA